MSSDGFVKFKPSEHTYPDLEVGDFLYSWDLYDGLSKWIVIFRRDNFAGIVHVSKVCPEQKYVFAADPSEHFREASDAIQTEAQEQLPLVTELKDRVVGALRAIEQGVSAEDLVRDYGSAI